MRMITWGIVFYILQPVCILQQFLSVVFLPFYCMNMVRQQKIVILHVKMFSCLLCVLSACQISYQACPSYKLISLVLFPCS